VSPPVEGLNDAFFRPVADRFAAILASQPGSGAALCVSCEGRVVMDVWGGSADAGGLFAWGRDSIVQPYSVGKPLAAVCALMLIDAGRLDLDAPVQRYWPEFRAPATVRQVLCHQAGVVLIEEPVETGAFYDWDRLCSLLARQEPAWDPGHGVGESALFYGHLVGELVRRVDRRSIGRFLWEQVCGPLELDFRFGLSAADQARAVELTGLDEEFRERNASGRPELYERAVSNPPGAQDASVVNGEAWRAAEIPAVNGHGTARALVGFYDSLGAGRLVSRDLLAEATRSQGSGPDLVMGGEVSWGMGFGIDETGFGMGGLGGSYAGVSRDGGYALAFVTASMGSHDRVEDLDQALRRCLGLA
jgi:CubicO group peptidase (beta-lactamase class C family)